METPIFEALKAYVDNDVTPFHVPGHKRGQGIDREFKSYVGSNIFQMDVNGMDDLDNICNPIGVIDRSQKLMAQLFGSDYAFYLLNGTTQGIQAMILHACRPGDKIIIPRNAHRSVISALILSGAIPIYVQPKMSYELGVAMGVAVEDIENAIILNPDAKAVFIINPTYYGMASDLASIVDIAHQNDMLVLVDEAHGSHLQFSSCLPKSAMACGADMSAISLHKTGGSMTQTSALLLNERRVNRDSLKTTLNLLQTTSGSYVLMASLEFARRQLEIKGREIIGEVLELAQYARSSINGIKGLYAFGSELAGRPGVWDFDETKMGVNVNRIGLTGYEVEKILRNEYNIQIEMSDFGNILAIISVGDTKERIETLIHALADIAGQRDGGKFDARVVLPAPAPRYCYSPREAHYATKETIGLKDAVGRISGEMLMAYPPGIPIICPGEEITKDIMEYINLLKDSNYQLQGTKDVLVEHIEVLAQ